jgi:hypothetical protein
MAPYQPDANQGRGLGLGVDRSHRSEGGGNRAPQIRRAAPALAKARIAGHAGGRRRPRSQQYPRSRHGTYQDDGGRSAHAQQGPKELAEGDAGQRAGEGPGAPDPGLQSQGRADEAKARSRGNRARSLAHAARLDPGDNPYRRADRAGGTALRRSGATPSDHRQPRHQRRPRHRRAHGRPGRGTTRDPRPGG